MAKGKKDKTETGLKSSILDKIIANSNGDMGGIIKNSSYFTEATEYIPTDIPALNIAFCGSIDGGFSGGLVEIGAPSKHFKSSFGLVAMRAFQKKHPDGIIIFYDSEGGITLDMLAEHGVDTSKVWHDWITNTDELITKMIPQLDGLAEKDPVMFFIDSIGGVSSMREFNNAMEGEVTTDMGVRAKEIKSFTRMINAKLKIKRIPCIMINHTYKTLSTYSTDQHAGGTGVAYSADTMWGISREQDKDKNTKVLEGWFFNIKIDKSRFIEEQVKFGIHVTYADGIAKYSGLAEIAEELGVISKVHGGYEFKDLKISSDDIDTNEVFWNRIFNETNFKKLVENKYKLGKKDKDLVPEIQEEA
jgi:RecA/RadA recombinase